MPITRVLVLTAFAISIPVCAAAQTGFWGPAVNVGAPINTTHNELSGVICPFDRALFFSRTVVGQNDLYVSYREGDQWGRPVPLTVVNSPLYNESNPTFAPDGSRLYFTSDREGGFGGFDIWTTTFDGIEWTTPEPLGPEINTANDEWFACQGPDGMYISARTEHGLNRGDIFFAAGSYGGFSPRVPVSALSSPSREMSAYPSLDGTALYLTCDRDGSAGLDDIWVSHKGESGWQEPVAVQCGLNEADYEQYPTAGGSMGVQLLFGAYGRTDSYGGADLYISDWHPLGDANGDQDISVSDVIVIINYVFSGGDPPPDPYNDDIDCNGQTNIVDAILLANYILRGGEPPCTSCIP